MSAREGHGVRKHQLDELSGENASLPQAKHRGWGTPVTHQQSPLRPCPAAGSVLGSPRPSDDSCPARCLTPGLLWILSSRFTGRTRDQFLEAHLCISQLQGCAELSGVKGSQTLLEQVSSSGPSTVLGRKQQPLRTEALRAPGKSENLPVCSF